MRRLHRGGQGASSRIDHRRSNRAARCLEGGLMSAIHEKAFEEEICAHLAANGWLYSPTGVGYDKTRALFAEDVFAWLESTQPAEWMKVVKPSMSATEQ